MFLCIVICSQIDLYHGVYLIGRVTRWSLAPLSPPLLIPFCPVLACCSELLSREAVSSHRATLLKPEHQLVPHHFATPQLLTLAPLAAVR
jgi:hypothetical protein